MIRDKCGRNITDFLGIVPAPLSILSPVDLIHLRNNDAIQLLKKTKGPIMGHWTRFGFECYQPGSLLFANTFGSMGFAFHTAVGAKAAFPERKVVGFCGDGGFMFTDAWKKT